MADDNISAFRREVREFLATAIPADIREKVRRYRDLEKSDYVRWQKILHQRGWFLGAWPKAWGGEGWDALRQLAFLQESGEAGAPMIIPYGVSMVGPVLNRFGSDEQKRRHLPGIISSDVWWCQGYSEPGAGSDLAALKTSATREGNHYRVNGSKMWTTEAHWSDWMHCLVRTSSSGRKQEGISFLLIDMKTPGLTVRPIVTIDGQHHTNQVFFDDVMVPTENLVGEEGAGWTIAKFLLSHERLSISDTGPKLRLLRRLQRINAAIQENRSVPEGLKSNLARRIVDVTVQIETLRAMEQYFAEGWSRGRPQGTDASILKVRGTEILQALSELAVDLQGPYAATHEPHDLHAQVQGEDSAAEVASAMAHQYLYGRCWSIFGGTNEIQRNIIAKAALASVA
ncbi:MAG TPA: acyl-CoA dehydrogenase family protein [Sphingomicrobium sp.]|nr:acyl-CoA dehydrogenase family protein [Sphingomicrobium sp.]